MDTIKMPSYLGYRYILWVVDHFSDYGFVGKLKNRNSDEMGDELAWNLSSSMIPDVLQSDNGREVRDLLKLLLLFFGINCHLFGILLNYWIFSLIFDLGYVFCVLPKLPMSYSVPWRLYYQVEKVLSLDSGSERQN